MLLVVSVSVVVGLQVLSVSVRSCLRALSFVFLGKIGDRVDSHQLCEWWGCCRGGPCDPFMCVRSKRESAVALCGQLGATPCGEPLRAMPPKTVPRWVTVEAFRSRMLGQGVVPEIIEAVVDAATTRVDESGRLLILVRFPAEAATAEATTWLRLHLDFCSCFANRNFHVDRACRAHATDPANT